MYSMHMYKLKAGQNATRMSPHDPNHEADEESFQLDCGRNIERKANVYCSKLDDVAGLAEYLLMELWLGFVCFYICMQEKNKPRKQR